MRINKRKIISVLLSVLLIMGMIPEIGFAADQPTISIGSITAEKGSEVSVPITISGNTGICGATLSVRYDKALQLTKITKGEGLSGLTMTPPGRLSANPVKIVWDGIEEDSSNGTVALLTFTVPEKDGEYPITLSYEDGDIVNGVFDSVEPEISNGVIKVKSDQAEQKMLISVDDVEAGDSGSVNVPIRVEGNTGICGATLSVRYDEALRLTKVSKGEAFADLTMTPPGKLSNNPIKIVWDGIEADSTNGTIVVLTFDAPDESGSYQVSVSYDDGDIVDGNLNIIEPEVRNGMITVNGCDHDYAVSYSWNDDGTTCTASAVCKIDSSHILIETGKITSEVKQAAACSEKGITTYTAEFENTVFETQTKDIKDIDLISHTVVKEDAVEATCTEVGKTEGSYCSVCNEVIKAQETIPAKGHDYGDAQYDWSEDGKTCTASLVCRNDSSHVISENGTISSRVKTESTPTEKGTTEYTATFNNELFAAQVKEIQDIEFKEPSENTGKICVSSDSVRKGGTVDVTVKITENPGVVMFGADIEYDTNVLKLESVQDGGILGIPVHPPVSVTPYHISWQNPTSMENLTGTGTAITLTFSVAEDAPVGNYPITLKYDSDNEDILNYDGDTVDFVVENGNVRVFLVGDVNGDGKVTSKDNIALSRYIAKWPGYEDIDLKAADVNLDGKVTSKDSMIMSRYIAKWPGYETLPIV